MKYGFMPKAMWAIFSPTFERELYRMSSADAKTVMRRAAQRYQQILAPIPAFEKGDRFLVNILSGSMLAAVYLELPEKPTLKQVEDFYHHAMTDNPVMKLFLKKKSSYTAKAQAKLAQQAKDSADRAERNPYTWRFTYEPGTDINHYCCRFTTCGLKYLMETLGIAEIIPAMCTYDYDMAELAGSIFTREYTLAAGGPCCDCHYRKREKQNEQKRRNPKCL